MGKKEFAATTLDPEHESFVVHVTLLSSVALSSFSLLDVHPSCIPQIAGLIAKEAPTKVPNEYFNFADAFSPNLASELPQHTWINKYTIKLVDGQQPLYGPIYSLKLMELETLKAYIRTTLSNGYRRQHFKLSMATSGTKWCISSPLIMPAYSLRLKNLDANNQAGGIHQYIRICNGGPKNDDKSLCGSISKVKNISVTISAKYLD